MAVLCGSNAPVIFGDYIVPSTTDQGTAVAQMLGNLASFPDVDLVATTTTKNTNYERECVLVKNGSGVAITPGMALNFVTAQWGLQVQACPNAAAIRCFAPSYVRGSTSTTIPDGSYFFAVKKGPLSILSDGTSLAVNDSVVVGGTSGQVATNYGLGGGLVYATAAASTVITSTTSATKFDKSYTFPANSLRAGDVIRSVAQIAIPSANSTDTQTYDLMLGSQVIATLTAFDPTDGGGDVVTISSDIVIRTAGASGTLVAEVVFTKKVNATYTTFTVALGSTAIDTTATQQLAVRATASVSSASNQTRLDVFNVQRLNTTSPGISSGIAIAASTGTGTAAQFRAFVNCNW